jgi:serine phosphatase RsbU (regulator of sigma subunit)
VDAKELQRQLGVARDIQSWLLPQKLPRVGGYDFDAAYDASDDIAGDLYDFIEHEQGQVGFVVAETTETGVPAAIVMAHVRGVLRDVARTESNPPYILKALNERLLTQLRNATFVTAIYAKLIPISRSMLVACAGHLPMFVVRARTGACERVQPPGVALGSADPAIFNPLMEGTSVMLAPGDRFVLATDACAETRNLGGEPFGLDRLEETICENATRASSEFTARVMGTLGKWRGPGRRADDVTIVTGRMLPAV